MPVTYPTHEKAMTSAVGVTLERDILKDRNNYTWTELLQHQSKRLSDCCSIALSVDRLNHFNKHDDLYTNMCINIEVHIGESSTCF